MNYADIKPLDITNGEGIRVSIFLSGCEHYCKNCFNKDLWDFNYGEPFNKKVLSRIIKNLSHEKVSGLSILGGEPLHPKNISGVLEIIKECKSIYKDKSIWVWTGYTYEEVLDLEYGLKILENIDVLVDGKYEESLYDLNYKYAGSTNQRRIDVPKSLKEKK